MIAIKYKYPGMCAGHGHDSCGGPEEQVRVLRPPLQVGPRHLPPAHHPAQTNQVENTWQIALLMHVGKVLDIGDYIQVL